MTEIHDILADGGETVKLIGFILFAVVVILASILQKAQKKQQEKDAARRREQGPPPSPAQRDRQEPVRRPAAPRPGMRQLTPAQQVAQAMREALGISPQQPTEPQEQVPPRARSAEEIRRLRAARSAKKKRARRPAQVESEQPARKPLSERQAGPVATATETVKPTPAHVIANLGDLSEARRAIVYHEIFSRPKALREGAEMWDL